MHKNSVLLFGLAGALSIGGSALAGPTYFLVTERPGQVVHGDSFVVPIDDAELLAHARDLIQRGPDVVGGSILFAEIRKGSDGLNRDLLKPDKPLWNWHVSKVAGFGDIGIELLDGWPTFVESDVDGWLQNTGGGVDPENPSAVPETGNIGFWSYTITRELPGYPDTIPVIPLPAAAPVAGALIITAIAFRKRILK
jgi:hypothetical protein